MRAQAGFGGGRWVHTSMRELTNVSKTETTLWNLERDKNNITLAAVLSLSLSILTYLPTLHTYSSIHHPPKQTPTYLHIDYLPNTRDGRSTPLHSITKHASVHSTRQQNTHILASHTHTTMSLPPSKLIPLVLITCICTFPSVLRFPSLSPFKPD